MAALAYIVGMRRKEQVLFLDEKNDEGGSPTLPSSSSVASLMCQRLFRRKWNMGNSLVAGRRRTGNHDFSIYMLQAIWKGDAGY